MKLAIVGGGGFRTPLVYAELLARGARLGVSELVLQDLDRRRLDRIGQVLDGLAREAGTRVPYRVTTDLDEAVEGADFVLCAIRVGGLAGRVVDETVPLEFGVLGQETVGPGGIAFALRTLPVMLAIAERVAEHAPRAWFVNFTNPVGLVTEALRSVLGARVVGVCDSPWSLCRRVARALGTPMSALWFDYFGLNHLGWLRAARAEGVDLLPSLLADTERLTAIARESGLDPEALRALRMIPNEYLHYYYNADDTVRALRSAGQTRAQYLLAQQGNFYAANGSAAETLAAWRQTRSQRDQTYLAEARRPDEPREAAGGGYERVAMSVIESIALDRRDVLILNVANGGALGFLDDDAVVEVPSVVGSAGAFPLAVAEIPQHARSLIEAVKAVERATIDAAATGSRQSAIRALTLHPLVPSADIAERIFAAYLDRLPTLRETFTR